MRTDRDVVRQWPVRGKYLSFHRNFGIASVFMSHFSPPPPTSDEYRHGFPLYFYWIADPRSAALPPCMQERPALIKLPVVGDRLPLSQPIRMIGPVRRCLLSLVSLLATYVLLPFNVLFLLTFNSSLRCFYFVSLVLSLLADPRRYTVGLSSQADSILVRAEFDMDWTSILFSCDHHPRWSQHTVNVRCLQ